MTKTCLQKIKTNVYTALLFLPTDFDNVVGKPETTPGHTQQQPPQGAGGGGDRPLQQPREGERQQQTVLA
jgi:hypothetical protein